jgi:hypothetical protein
MDGPSHGHFDIPSSTLLVGKQTAIRVEARHKICAMHKDMEDLIESQI